MASKYRLKLNYLNVDDGMLWNMKDLEGIIKIKIWMKPNSTAQLRIKVNIKQLNRQDFQRIKQDKYRNYRHCYHWGLICIRPWSCIGQYVNWFQMRMSSFRCPFIFILASFVIGLNRLAAVWKCRQSLENFQSQLNSSN